MKKMSLNKKRKITAGVAAGLATTMLLAGTFAWIQMNEERVNRMNSKTITDGSVKVNEEFIPNTEWEIGTEHSKDVSVSNTGSQRVFVRVSYEEVLKVYGNDGEPIPKPTAATAASELPVKFADDKYKDSEGWKDVPAGQFTPELPAGVKVKIKGTKSTETNAQGEPVEKAEMEYVIYSIYETDKAQKMSATINLDEWAGAGPETWTYNISGLSYYVYDGETYFANDWAGTNTLLGKDSATVGKRNGVDFDYTSTGLGGLTIPVPVTPSAGANVPKEDPADASRWIAPFQSDETLDKALYTIYHAAAMSDTVPAPLGTPGVGEKLWHYSETDGYFYYLDVLNSGETTPSFLKALGFDSTATKKYSDMQLDLIVNMEAIQAVKDAVTDPNNDEKNGGWGVADPAVAPYLQSLVAK